MSTKPCFCAARARTFIDYYENPRLAHHLLTVCTQTLIAVADRLRQYTSHISTGVSSILGKTAPQAYLTSNCTVDMISADLYETYLMPYDIQLAEHFGVFAVHHCGMHCERFAPLYRKIPNLVWLEAGAHSDFHAVRSACENSWLIYAILLKNLLGESIQRFKKTSVLAIPVPPLSRRETISQVCRVLESTSIRQIKM